MNAAIDPNQADALASIPMVEVPEQPPSRPHRKGGKGARPPASVAPAPEPTPESEPEPAAEPEPAPEPVLEVVAVEPEPAPEPAPESELLVSSRDEDRRETTQEVAVEPPKEQPKPKPKKAPPSIAAQRVKARRETCGALEEHLTRRIKRALQDEQNLVLDRLRSVRGMLNADSALGSEADHLASYVTIVEPALADAARAGAAVAGKPQEVPAHLVATVANDLALELVLPLRRRLDERLHEAAAVGDDQITASDRVSSAYREVKTQRAGRLAEDWLAAAWAVGVHAATPAGTAGTWASDPDHPCCTDCDDNGLAGGVPAGSAFPTGHLHPPAHPGCRCVVIPST
jgi:hypothetical protein